MSNLDNDLREMFRRRESDLAPGATVPEKLVRRTRGRQVWTALGSVGLVLALVGGTVIGARWLSSSDESERLGGSGQTRTTTINGITITFPQGWFAVDPVDAGIEPDDPYRSFPSVMLIVSPEDPATSNDFGCPRLAEDSDDHLLMTVRETRLALIGEAAAPWPVALQPFTDEADSIDSACFPGWTFLQSLWTDAGRSFKAVLGFGRDVSEADRTALLDAYESMSFAGEGPIQPDKTVVAEGTEFDSTTWFLEADPKTGEHCFNHEIGASGGGMCSSGEATQDVPEVTVLNAGKDGGFAVGTVPEGVLALVVQTADGSVGGAQLIQPPGSLDGFRYFVVPLPGEGEGALRFQDRQGNDLYPSQYIRWGGAENDEATPPTSGPTSSAGSGQPGVDQ